MCIVLTMKMALQLLIHSIFGRHGKHFIVEYLYRRAFVT
jgi:hypothetical protein